VTAKVVTPKGGAAKGNYKKKAQNRFTKVAKPKAQPIPADVEKVSTNIQVPPGGVASVEFIGEGARPKIRAEIKLSKNGQKSDSASTMGKISMNNSQTAPLSPPGLMKRCLGKIGLDGLPKPPKAKRKPRRFKKDARICYPAGWVPLSPLKEYIWSPNKCSTNLTQKVPKSGPKSGPKSIPKCKKSAQATSVSQNVTQNVQNNLGSNVDSDTTNECPSSQCHTRPQRTAAAAAGSMQTNIQLDWESSDDDFDNGL
jgi:hypothetical protein